jgi:hypothetical protein
METEEQEGFEQKVSKVPKSGVPLLRGEETATCVFFKDRTYNCKRSTASCVEAQSCGHISSAILCDL